MQNADPSRPVPSYADVRACLFLRIVKETLFDAEWEWFTLLHTTAMTPKLPILVARLSIAAAIVASGMMVLGRTTGFQTPGCGPESGCALAAASAWAKIPGMGLSTASASLAAFFAVGVGLCCTDNPDRGTRWLARLCALGSMLFLAVGAVERLWCPWCLACHAGSLLCWAAIEIAGRGPRTPWNPIRASAAIAVAVATAASLGLVERRHEQEIVVKRGVEAAESITRIAAGGQSVPGFTGRYSLGATSPKVRVVAFTGYQCPDCRVVDAEIERLVGVRTDTSLSTFHFPFCADCNPGVTQTIHSNACFAAAAAEAAGIVSGPDGFWRMHRRLFELRGAFTRESLSVEVRTLGLDSAGFFKAYDAPDTLDLVRGDAQRAIDLGLNRTPTVFVNGVELKGWNAPDAIARALEAAAKSGTAAVADRPPTGTERALAEWLAETPVILATDAADHRIGATGADAIRIDVFGDYQDDGTAALDTQLREQVAKDPTLAYHFRHFPADSKCNPAVPRSLHPLACRMARTAEAFGLVGGEDAFWAIHEWTLANHRVFADSGLRVVAEQRNLDWAAILALRDQAETTRAVAEDVALGQTAKVTQLPWILIDGRRLAAWKVDKPEILLRAIELAKSQKATPTSP